MADTVYKLTHTGEQIDSAIDNADNAVRSDAQILTSEQQTQARTNIGAAPVSPYTKSGNPIVLSAMADSITSLVLRGATTQSGTGDPSPTNIRPISGVGAYRSNGYYTDIVVTTNGVPKTYTAGPMNSPLFDGDVLTWSGGSTVKVARNSGITSIDGKTIKFTVFSTYWNLPDHSSPMIAAVPESKITCSHFFRKLATNRAREFCFTLKDYMAGIFQTADELNAFCVEQMANETPVTVLYPLATPTTETVPISEPITNAAGTVTVSAENTLDVTIAGVASAADLTTETNERITADTGVRGLTATVEATSTASKAYAIGAYFVYNGLLYKCTVAIAQGKTITPGTNCTATTAGAEISTLNQNRVATGYAVNPAVVTAVNALSVYKCCNKICIVSFNIGITAPVGTSALVTGLPQNADTAGTSAICYFGSGITTLKMTGTTLYLNYLDAQATGNLFGQIVYPIA